MSDGQGAVTISGVLREASLRFAPHEALVDEERRLTYAALEDEAEGVARALIGSGIGPGDRVAVWAPNGVTWVVLSFGVYLAGAILVPLNTRYKGEEAAHVLRTSQARLLFTVTDFLDGDLVALLRDVKGLDALEERVVLHGPVPADACVWRQ